MPANNKLVTVDDLSSVASSIATKADNRFSTDAFKYVAVAGVTMAASVKADTMNLVAGNHVTLTPDASTKTITISSSGGGGGGGSTTVETQTLSANNWSNGTYDLSSIYPNNEYNVTISAYDGMTAAQYTAFNKAQIVGSATSNIISARGTVPTVDIPVMVAATEK